MSSKEIRPLTDKEQKDVVDQYEELRGRSQRAFDDAIRAIAAGAVAVTASLTAAFKGAGWSGSLAVAFSLAALIANLLSFWTPQRDADLTIDRAWDRDRAGIFDSPWRKATGYLNFTAFLCIALAGVCLLVFVSSVS
jgi:hypothetical protein